MPTFKFDGRAVHFEVEGSGPPLLVHHGFMQWAEDWRASGWLDRISSLRTVVLFDALGHGRSDRPHEKSAYRVEARANLAAGLADTLGFEKFGFFGFSMGGRVGYEIARSLPERLTELIVGGMHARSPSLDAASLNKRALAFRSGRLSALERAVGAMSGRPPNDAEALALSTEAVMEWLGAEDALGCIKVPTLVFCGSRDPLFEDARSCAGKIAGAQFVPLNDATHAHSFYRSGLALPSVLAFLAERP